MSPETAGAVAPVCAGIPVDWISPISMVTHMKTTIEIADALLERAKARARDRRVTLRSLIEESLAATLEKPLESAQIRPVTFNGNGLNPDFQDASWDKIRDEIYR